MRAIPAVVCSVLVSSFTLPALAQVSSGGSVSFSTERGATATGGYQGPWIKRYRPEPHQVELGVFAGILSPGRNHNLHDEDETRQHFPRVAPDFGLRVGYFPLTFLGVEAEGALIPTITESDDESALLWRFGGQAVLQLPGYRVVPFALIGVGRLGVSSETMGDDGDPSWHFGAGVKVAVTRMLDLRLDVRDHVTQRNITAFNDADEGDPSFHPEFLLGATFVLGRREPVVAPPPAPPPPPPPAPVDTDGDGIVDPSDECPAEPGPAPTGCPPKDTDKDGFVDPEDKCPDQPGIAPDGCPDLDPDKDGVLDPNDKCPTEPETKNGFEDSDGCPDELPEEIKKFSGVIAGINFEFAKANIRADSRPVLDNAVKVLKEFPSVRIEISGHTDNVGTDEVNKKLSQERADSVKAYLVERGVEADRITTRGAGPDEPVADNKTPAGRQKNRRIEFKILTQ